MTPVASHRRGGVATALLALVVVLAFAGTLLSIGALRAAAASTAAQLLFVAPGLLIVARTQAKGTGWLPVVAFGPIIGFGSSSFALLGFWAAGARGSWLLVAAPFLASLLAWPASRLRDRWRLTATAPGDARMLLLALLLVPVIVWKPFANVGAERPEGRIYRQYFTADYVWVRAVVAEVAKGDFPPVNPYYTGDALHYYWLPHLLSAVEYRAWPDLDLDALLLTRTVLVDAMFVAALYGVARLAVALPSAALAGVLCGFLATSFEAAAAWWRLGRDGSPPHFIRYLNIDAVSRWFYQGMPIDGLQRILWYQPHHATGYILGLLGVLALTRRRREVDPTVFGVAGALLAVSTVISSVAGVMFTAVAVACEALRTVVRRAWLPGLFNAPYAALPLVVGAALVTLLQYVDHTPGADAGLVRFGLNRLSVRNFWVVTAMSFGPALLLGAAGMWAAWRQRARDVWPFLVLLPVVAGFYFFVDVRDHQDVYVGWRVGHLTFMALVPVIGLAFADIASLRDGPRHLAAGAVALIVALALPTVIVDVFNTQDIEPNGMGRAWRRTEVITPAEQAGLEFLRTRTAARSVVQVDTLARDEMWAYIPAFAERRMAVGVPISMVPLLKYQEGARRIQWMYDADAASAFALADRVGIDYIVVGAPERTAHPGIEARWSSHPELLPIVFRNDALAVYRVWHRPR